MRNKKNEKSLEFQFAKLYVNEVERAKKDIEFTYNRIKLWEDLKNSHYDMEPLKIFKNKHKDWKNKLDDYNKRLFEMYKELEEDMDDYLMLLDY